MKLASEKLTELIAKKSTKKHVIKGVDIYALNKDEVLVDMGDTVYGVMSEDAMANSNTMLYTAHDEVEARMLTLIFTDMENIELITANLRGCNDSDRVRACYRIVKKARDRQAEKLKEVRKEEAAKAKTEKNQKAFKKTLSESGYELFMAGRLVKCKHEHGSRVILKSAIDSIISNDTTIVSILVNGIKVVVPKNANSILKVLELSDIYFSRKKT